jgi:DNA-binding MarR family transcriptional regulator
MYNENISLSKSHHIQDGGTYMLTRFEQFTSSIAGIYKHIQKIERDEMIKYGLKGSYAQYLLAIGRFENGITSSKLCEICDKDKAAISRIVAEMEQHGLIYRDRINDNLYRAMLKLTEKGKEAADKVSLRAQIAVEAAGKGLTDESRMAFYSALNLIATNLQEISKDGIPNE